MTERLCIMKNIFAAIRWNKIICLLTTVGILCLIPCAESRAAGIFALTMLLTLGNAAAVALTIMCISRYMVYNMPFLYLSAFLLLGEMKEKLWGGNKQGFLKERR